MKRAIALLCAAMLLTGCSEAASDDILQTVEETQDVTAEVQESAETEEQTTAPTEEVTLPSDTEEEREVPRYLCDNTYRDIESFEPQFYEMDRALIKEDILKYQPFRVIDPHELYIEDAQFEVRRSSGVLRMSEDELRDMVGSAEYTDFAQYADNSMYALRKDSAHITVQPDYSEGIKGKSLQLGYAITDMSEYSFNVFIRKGEGNECFFIVDPAYISELPLLTSRTECMEFDINGTTVYADTLAFTTRDHEERDIPSDYVYAKISVGSIEVTYNTESGYDNRAGRLLGYELISEDTDSMLMDAYLFNGEDKDPAMSEVYSAIMNGLDSVMQENTNGLTLLDLDFDGTPELLVSSLIKKNEESNNDYHAYGCDVGVYRIENGGLKYIDTIYSEQRIVYEIANNLGLITLEDGRKGWFGTSYKNRDTEELQQTDYFYQLAGDELMVTEVFGSREGDGSTYSDLKYFNDEETDFYYFGEKMIFTEVVNENYVPDEAYSTPYFLVWEDESSIFGAWEIYGFARAAFCENIEKSFRLYSPWLSGEGGGQPKELTERELSYNIAYMVDSFYLGEYNAAEYSYRYWFLGDYAKPVIYLYPEEQTEVSVQVGFTSGGAITCSYPDYNGGWNVTAMPDGTIYDDNGDEYYCLYWEGTGAAAYDTSKGWCVAGADTADFLREKLMYIGLSAREANEFIIYWLPLMQGNEYNIISLHTEQYAAEVPLTVSPAPDTQIRVFMTYTPAEEYVEIQPQVLPSYERSGFVLVEWGGAAD